MTEDDAARLAQGWLPGDGSIDAIRAEHEDNRQRRISFPQGVNPYTFERVKLLLTRITELEAEVARLQAALKPYQDQWFLGWKP